MSLGNPERPVGGLAVRAPSGVELRPLGRDDLAEAVALARECHGVESANDLDVLRPRFEALLGSADVAPFVAELGGAAAGIGILHFRRRLNFTTFEGWISELFVRPAARGRGIGRALLDALVAEWRLRGGHRLQIQVPAQAPAAEALLARAGLEAWMLDFEQRPLAPAGPAVAGWRQAATGRGCRWRRRDGPALRVRFAPDTSARAHGGGAPHVR